MKNLTTLMLNACLMLPLVAMAADDVPPKSHPDSADWKSLFNGDLSDAIFPAGVWSVTDGVLTATEDQCIWTKEVYDDCIIDLEFKTAEGTNSGVIVYASETDNWIPNSVEIQIADDFAEQWANSPKTWQCGAIFGRLAASKSMVKKPGQWNRMTVTCKGPMIWVMLNGKQVTELDMRKWTSATKNPDGSEIPAWLNKPLSELPTKGHIGLQGKHAGAPIYFRNVKIKTL
ncbi:MAG: DUF1080 domain-containing protein [Planctomycetes bacterium]|nr:DUF1080 domain-containing protein [Planctomycetota bacterium]